MKLMMAEFNPCFAYTTPDRQGRFARGLADSYAVPVLERGRRGAWQVSLRGAGSLAVVLVALGDAGCGCPHPNYNYDRVITASITLADDERSAVPETLVAVDAQFTEWIGLQWFKNGPQYEGMSPVVLPGDLLLANVGSAHGTTNPTAAADIGFSMIIHGIVGGPAEIDLDDTRVQLQAGIASAELQHDVSGHLSFARFSSVSCQTVTACDLSVDGTFAFVSTGSGGQRTTVTNGTIRANDTIWEDRTCAPSYNGND